MLPAQTFSVLNPARQEHLTNHSRPASTVGRVTLDELQRTIAQTYGERDSARGVPATIAWLAEELGELAQAVRKGTREQQREELGDVLAWLASLANQLDLSLADAVEPYADGCKSCGERPCRCG